MNNYGVGRPTAQHKEAGTSVWETCSQRRPPPSLGLTICKMKSGSIIMKLSRLMMSAQHSALSLVRDSPGTQGQALPASLLI